MKECWRWFGPADPVQLSDLPQVGASGVVTALHQFTPGVEWPREAIAARKGMIEAAGLDWAVVESLPVSETIKTQAADMPAHLEAYKASLTSLAAEGIETICYNFMPILDWTRTELRAKQPHGGAAMRFDLLDFATFDLHLLARPDASADYPDAVNEAAARRLTELDDAARQTLVENITAGLPGANDSWTVDDIRNLLQTYAGVDAHRLRQNLIDFLGEVVPHAQSLGLRMCCHPDDPPFPLLGLPRVMSSTEDYAAVLEAVDLQANGATLCTGSLGVSPDFDAPGFVKRFGPRIHFAHLRNTTRSQSLDPDRPNFFEDAHLEGDTDMVATLRALLEEEARRRAEGRQDAEIPMRPDHGQDLLTDHQLNTMPGYPLVGRMRGLAELRGVMAALM